MPSRKPAPEELGVNAQGERLIRARRVRTLKSLTRPGDYYVDSVLKQDAPVPCVWFLLPIADPAKPMFSDASSREAFLKTRANGLHMITAPPWRFTEQADGSLQVRDSIACGRGDTKGEYFHGFLDAGNVWRVLP